MEETKQKDVKKSLRDERSFIVEDVLRDYPFTIRSARIYMLDKTRELKSMENRLSVIQKAIEKNVLDDSAKEELKASLSNAQKRDLEIKKRLSEHEEYGKLSDELVEEKYKMDRLAIDVDTKRQVLRSSVALALGGFLKG